MAIFFYEVLHIESPFCEERRLLGLELCFFVSPPMPVAVWKWCFAGGGGGSTESGQYRKFRYSPCSEMVLLSRLDIHTPLGCPETPGKLHTPSVWRLFLAVDVIF